MASIEEDLFLSKRVDGKVCFAEVAPDNYKKVAEYLKNKGYVRLLTISAVDWIDQQEFEVYFVAHNPEEKTYIKVATRIPRDNPKIASLLDIWPNAAMHERETWELFGIVFDGNNMLKPLFLEDWDGPPPFRKDFDLREYAMRLYEEVSKQ